MKHAILIPTRKRTEALKRVYHSAMETVKNPQNILFVFYIDDDDLESVRMAKELNKKHQNVYWITDSRITMSQMWNECQKMAVTLGAELFMGCADDIIFRTPNWDTEIEKVFEQYPDRIALVFGDDGNWHGRLGTHSWVHKNWIDTVGYIFPPYFVGDYGDTWLNEVADMIGRKVYLPHVLTEHMHPAFNKALMDATYQDKIDRCSKSDMAKLFESKQKERKRDSKKLLTFIREFNK